MNAALVASMVLALGVPALQLVGPVSADPARQTVMLASTASTPQVVAISPAEGEIPANTLRLYVTFDRPARGVVTTRDLQLVDAEGRTVDGAFMDFGQDLWSPDGQRLTVLFDPGRVKQDVEGDGDSAAPLQPDFNYTVDVGGKRFNYHVTAALRTPIDPHTWGLSLPNPGSREALTVTFDREMDVPLLHDQLEVVDDQGRSQSGRITASNSGTAWCWRPYYDWHPGAYELVIGSSLEDVSGNRVGEALDHDVGAPDAPSQDSFLPFKVGPRVVRQNAAAC